MTIVHRVSKSRQVVIDYLSDIKKFVSVHPVITRMDTRSDGSYLVHETLKVGFIPISFTYSATIETDLSKNRVTMCARVMMITEVKMTFDCEPDGDFTIVTENVSISSILPVKSIVNRIFREQHVRLFERIGTAN
jgi:carbon monoxide dehydrogenase subunit G